MEWSTTSFCRVHPQTTQLWGWNRRTLGNSPRAVALQPSRSNAVKLMRPKCFPCMGRLGQLGLFYFISCVSRHMTCTLHMFAASASHYWLRLLLQPTYFNALKSAVLVGIHHAQPPFINTPLFTRLPCVSPCPVPAFTSMLGPSA